MSIGVVLRNCVAVSLMITEPVPGGTTSPPVRTNVNISLGSTSRSPQSGTLTVAVVWLAAKATEKFVND